MTSNPPNPDQIVRVVRTLTYIGPRAWVESTLARSKPDGTFRAGPNHTIHFATLGIAQIVPPTSVLTQANKVVAALEKAKETL